MKITKKQLKKMIMEMLDAEHPSEVEAVEDVWSGDIELKDRNLAHFIDHPKAYGGDETTREPEMLARQEDLVAESRLRVAVRRIIREEIEEAQELEEAEESFLKMLKRGWSDRQLKKAREERLKQWKKDNPGKVPAGIGDHLK